MVAGWTSRGFVIAIFPTGTSSLKRIPRVPVPWTLRWPILVAPGSELQRSVVSWTRRKGRKGGRLQQKEGVTKRQQKVWQIEMSQMFKHVNFETVISLNFPILFLKHFKLMAKKKMTKKSRHLPGQVVTSIVTWVGNGIFATCSSSWIATAWCTSVALLSTKALLRWCEF